ncbi:MAG: response regulator [Anaerolineae bacterium]
MPVSDEQQAYKIFIVEDDVDLSEMLSAYFKVQGYDVAGAIRGEDAVRGIGETLPDVIVLDIRLPDIDGYEVCRRIRKARRTQNIPIIFLTEKREREDKLTGLELGAVDYITKPFDIQELRLRVRNALRRSQMSTMHHPVTGLPEGILVRERLEQLSQQADWGVILTSIRALDKFRDKFGFVSADDVARAVALMITNVVQAGEGENDFVGHTDAGDFIILTTSARCRDVAERCLVRLERSVQYFYPAMERQRLHELPESERLTVYVACLTSHEHRFVDIDTLFAELTNHPL